MDKYPKNLSTSRTLCDEMIRLYEEKKENIISDRKILVMDQHFEGITGVTRSVLSSIKKGKSRPMNTPAGMVRSNRGNGAHGTREWCSLTA
jgi:hypothetical protein